MPIQDDGIRFEPIDSKPDDGIRFEPIAPPPPSDGIDFEPAVDKNYLPDLPEPVRQSRLTYRNKLKEQQDKIQAIQEGEIASPEAGSPVDFVLGTAQHAAKGFTDFGKSMFNTFRFMQDKGQVLPPELQVVMAAPGVKEQVDDYIKTGRETFGKASDELADDIRMSEPNKFSKFTGKVTEGTVGMIPLVAAAAVGGTPLMAALGGLQTAGNTYDEAEKAYKAQGLSDEEAKDKAWNVGLASGAANAALVGLMHPLGIYGSKMMRSALGMPVADVVGHMAPKTFKDVLVNSAKEIWGGVKFAVLDHAIQSGIAKVSYAPDMTLGEFLQDTFHAAAEMGAISAITGAALGADTLHQRSSRLGKILEYRKARQDFKDFIQQRVDDLNDKVTHTETDQAEIAQPDSEPVTEPIVAPQAKEAAPAPAVEEAKAPEVKAPEPVPDAEGVAREATMAFHELLKPELRPTFITMLRKLKAGGEMNPGEAELQKAFQQFVDHAVEANGVKAPEPATVAKSESVTPAPEAKPAPTMELPIQPDAPKSLDEVLPQPKKEEDLLTSQKGYETYKPGEEIDLERGKEKTQYKSDKEVLEKNGYAPDVIDEIMEAGGIRSKAQYLKKLGVRAGRGRLSKADKATLYDKGFRHSLYATEAYKELEALTRKHPVLRDILNEKGGLGFDDANSHLERQGKRTFESDEALLEALLIAAKQRLGFIEAIKSGKVNPQAPGEAKVADAIYNGDRPTLAESLKQDRTKASIFNLGDEIQVFGKTYRVTSKDEQGIVLTRVLRNGDLDETETYPVESKRFVSYDGDTRKVKPITEQDAKDLLEAVPSEGDDSGLTFKTDDWNPEGETAPEPKPVADTDDTAKFTADSWDPEPAAPEPKKQTSRIKPVQRPKMDSSALTLEQGEAKDFEVEKPKSRIRPTIKGGKDELPFGQAKKPYPTYKRGEQVSVEPVKPEEKPLTLEQQKAKDLPTTIKPEEVETAPGKRDVNRGITPERLLDMADWDNARVVPGEPGKGKQSAAAYEQVKTRAEMFKDVRGDNRRGPSKVLGIFINEEKGLVMVSSIWSQGAEGPSAYMVAVPENYFKDRRGAMNFSKVLGFETEKDGEPMWKPYAIIKTREVWNNDKSDRVRTLFKLDDWRKVEGEFRRRSAENKNTGMAPVEQTEEALKNEGMQTGSASEVGSGKKAPHEVRGSRRISAADARDIIKSVGEKLPEDEAEARSAISEAISTLKDPDGNRINTLVTAFNNPDINKADSGAAAKALIDHILESYEGAANKEQLFNRLQNRLADEYKKLLGGEQGLAMRRDWGGEPNNNEKLLLNRIMEDESFFDHPDMKQMTPETLKLVLHSFLLGKANYLHPSMRELAADIVQKYPETHGAFGLDSLEMHRQMGLFEEKQPDAPTSDLGQVQQFFGITEPKAKLNRLLQKIAEKRELLDTDITSDQHEAIAALAEAIIGKSSSEVTFVEKAPPKRRAAGRWFYKDGRIEVYLDGLRRNSSGRIDEGSLQRVIMHEAIHSVTSEYIARRLAGEDLGERVNHAIDSLVALHDQYLEHLMKTENLSREQVLKMSSNHGEGDFWYGGTNVLEFVAEAMTNYGFQRTLAKIKSNFQSTDKSNPSLWRRFTQSVAKFIRAYMEKVGVNNRSILQDAMEYTQRLIEGYDIANRGKFEGEDSLDLPRAKEAIDIHDLKEDDTKGSGDKLLQASIAAEVVAQTKGLRDVVETMQTIAAKRNPASGRSTLKGPARQEQREIEETLNNKTIRSIFVEPIESMQKAATMMTDPLLRFMQAQRNRALPESEKSSITGEAVKVIDQFDGAYREFSNSYDSTKASLQAELDKVIEANAEVKSENQFYRAVKDNFINMLKQAKVAAASGTAMHEIKALMDRTASSLNVVTFIAKHPDAARIVKLPTALDISNYVDAAIGGDYTRLGASKEVLELVANAIKHSELLENDILTAHSFVDAAAAKPEINEFTAALKQAIKINDWHGAVTLFTDGVSKNAKLSERARLAGNFFAAKELKLLTKLGALEKSKALFDHVAGSNHFRLLSQSIWDKAGIRDIVHGMNEEGNAIIMKPIPGLRDEETVLKLEPSGKLAEQNRQKLESFMADAIAYIADSSNPMFDRGLAAGLRNFLDNHAPFFLDGAMLASQPRLVAGPVRKFTNFVLGRFTNSLRTVAQLGGGLAFENMSRTGEQMSASREAAVTSYRLHRPAVALALRAAAVKAHGMTPGEYQKKILNPLAAVYQHHESIRKLKVGDHIGNGYQVMAEDFTYLKAYRAFENDYFRRLSGTNEHAGILTQGEGRIVERTNDKLRTRLRFESGPYTVNRNWNKARGWWDEWKTFKTPAERIDLIDRNVDELLFGYLYDAKQPSLAFNHQFGDALEQILAEAKGGNPVSSHNNFIERLHDIVTQSTEHEHLTRADVSRLVMQEIDQLMRRVGYNVDAAAKLEVDTGITSLDPFGGKNAFNTARGEQVLPSLWYDYGAASDAGYLSMLASGVKRFANLHMNATKAAVDAISKRIEEQEGEIKAGKLTKAETLKARMEGQDFFSFGELKMANRELKRYLRNLQKMLQHETKNVPLDATGAGDSARTIAHGLATGVLANVEPTVRNAFGGLTNLVLADIGYMNTGAAKALVRGTKEGVKTAMAVVMDLIPDSVINKARAKPIIGGMAGHMADFLEAHHQLRQEAAELGINTNVLLRDTMRGIMEWSDYGGNASKDLGMPSALDKAGRKVNAGIRTATQLAGQASVGLTDSVINQMAFRMVEDLSMDLSVRSLKFMEPRVMRATAMGYDPYNIADSRNILSESELMKSSWNNWDRPARAAQLRELLRRQAGINIDAAIHRYYKDFTAAKAREIAEGAPKGSYTDKVSLFDRNQRYALVAAFAEAVNKASYANRPTWFKTSTLPQMLGLFKGFPSWQLYNLIRFTEHTSNQSFFRGSASNVPMLISLALAVAAGAIAGDTIADVWARMVLGRQRRSPSLLDAAAAPEHPGRFALAMANVVAGALPIYGTAFNYVTQGSYRSGFDLNSQFVHLNFLNDIFDKMREMMMTGSVVDPSIRFVERWLPAARVVTQFLPSRAGAQEYNNARNLVLRGAYLSGEMDNLRKSGGVSVYYGQATPVLNDARSAIGRGDMAAFKESYTKLVELKRQNGSATPEQDAARALQTLSPISQVFGTKPTEAELKSIMDSLPADQAEKITAVQRNYEQAMSSIGATPAQPTKGSSSSTGGGSGGSFGGGGATGGYGSTAGGGTSTVPSSPTGGGGGSSGLKGFGSGGGGFRSRLGYGKVSGAAGASGGSRISGSFKTKAATSAPKAASGVRKVAGSRIRRGKATSVKSVAKSRLRLRLKKR